MLEVEMHTTIETLFNKGYNKTQIARMLEIDRKTVRNVLKQIDEKGVVERKPTVSILDPHKEYIHIQVTKDLGAMRIFQDIDEAINFSREWLDNNANVRKHGTTKKIPTEVFKLAEKEKLLPLPTEDFILSSSVKCIVNTNCHISYDGNYYSVPYAYIGREVNVIVINDLIKVYFKEKEIALHSLWTGENGHHTTNNEHYPHTWTKPTLQEA